MKTASKVFAGLLFIFSVFFLFTLHVHANPSVGTLSGKVTFPDGTPVSGAQINASMENAPQVTNTPCPTPTGTPTPTPSVSPTPCQSNPYITQAISASDGTYSLTIAAAGVWDINLSPQYDPNTNRPVQTNWTYGGRNSSVTYTSTQGQSQTLNFVVTKVSATITGKVVNPDGTIPTANTAFVNVYNDTFGNGTPAGSDGTFSIGVPVGTFNVSVFVMASAPNGQNNMPQQSTTVGSPVIPQVAAADGATVNIGTITLLAKNNTISGHVTDSSGNSLSGQQVMAMQGQGGPGGMPNMATTDSSGNYILHLTDGSWTIQPAPSGMNGGNNQQQQSNQYVFTGNPVQTTVSGGQSVSSINFSVALADATISGKVVDSNGNNITNTQCMVFVRNDGGGFPSIGGQCQSDGTFSFKAPAGSYALGMYFPASAGYSANGTQNITVASGGTASATLTALKNDATISGSLVDSSGNVITGVNAQVFANNGNGGYISGVVSPATGTYTLAVAAGNWMLGYFVDPSSTYTSSFGGGSAISLTSGGSKTQNITLVKADSTITGIITLPDGSTPAVGAYVSVSTSTGTNTSKLNSPIDNMGGTTDSNGSYTIHIPSGTYYVTAHYPSSKGYINPKVVKVTLTANTQTVNESFGQSNLQITGSITLNGTKTQGFVSAFSDNGGYTDTTETNGSYTLNLTNDTNWHITATSTDGVNFYKSSVALVASGSASTTVDLALTKQAFSVPQPYTATFNATQPQVITLSNGMIITIPGSTLASSGSVTLTISPATSLEQQAGAIPVGIGLDISAVNSQGSAITGPFSQSIQISIPYTDAELSSLGLTPSTLNGQYWDSNNAVWKNSQTIVVDTANHVINIFTNHFTQYALLAAIDTTPPGNPTNVTAKAGSDGKSIVLTWTNPSSSNFNGVQIYRSTTQGQQGSLIATLGSTVTTYTDTAVTSGTTYYYTLLSINFNNVASSGSGQVLGLATELPNTASATLFDFLELLGVVIAGSIVYAYGYKKLWKR